MTPGEKKAYNKGFESGANSVEEGLPGWFGTFADMMTLLFAFFVLLAAISTMDPVKLQEMANSQGKSLGSKIKAQGKAEEEGCLLYTSPSPRDRQKSRMPSSA